MTGGISSPSRTFCSLEASNSPSVLWGADSFFPDSCSYAACCSPLVCLAKGQEGAFEVWQPFAGFSPAVLVCYLGKSPAQHFAFVQSSPHYFSSCISSGTRLTNDRNEIQMICSKKCVSVIKAAQDTVQMCPLSHASQGSALRSEAGQGYSAELSIYLIFLFQISRSSPKHKRN